ncbi:myosin regulatory light chain 2-like isoform X2 [Planococcus citri]
MFSTQQVAEFKEGFSMMDRDKDGILGKEDLRATWDQVGKLMSDKELDEMLHEAPGPINFTQLLSLFANKMAGGADDDETVRNAFTAFSDKGKIDSNKLKHALITWGDKFSQKEVADAFEAMDIDRNGLIDTEELIQMLIAGGEEE